MRRKQTAILLFLPPGIIAGLDHLIKLKFVANRNEAIREAIRDYLISFSHVLTSAERWHRRAFK